MQNSRHDALAGYPIMLSVRDVADILDVSRHTAEAFLFREMAQQVSVIAQSDKRRVIKVPREALRQKLGIPEARMVRFDK